jgi:hypothetical protein
VKDNTHYCVLNNRDYPHTGIGTLLALSRFGLRRLHREYLDGWLLGDGHEVVGCDNFSTGQEVFLARARESGHFRLVRGDVLNPQVLATMRQSRTTGRIAPRTFWGSTQTAARRERHLSRRAGSRVQLA